MAGRSPSITARLAGGFLISYAAVLLGILAVIELTAGAVGEPYRGTDAAVELLLRHVEEAPDGRLRLRPGGALERLDARSPGLWLIARSDSDLLVRGEPPEEAVRMVSAYPFAAWNDVWANIPVRAADGRAQRVSVEGVKTAHGPMILAAGGVEPRAAGPGLGVLAMVRAGLLWFLLALVVLGIAAVLIVTPMVLRTIRPLTDAVSGLDPADLGRRLPEAGIARELGPVVRAFNGALARLEDALERRRRFMADLAHELRTPLAVLTMHAEALPEGQARGDIQRGLFRLSQMIGQMLDSERLGGPGRRRAPVDLVAMAKAAVAEVAPLAIDAGYEMTFSSDAEQVVVEGDEHAVARALTNLLGNAVAHAGGAGMIAVRVLPRGVIEVGDQGPGLSDEARERVFDPFHRERWDRDGCGLGLHLVREIMRAHGGSAEAVESAQGALFRLTFALNGKEGVADGAREKA